MDISKLRGKVTKSLIVLSILAGGVLLAWSLMPAGDDEGKLTDILLAKPAFAQEMATFPADEAGISAYVNVGQTIDLSKAKRSFKRIAKETSTYVIGIVELPGLPLEASPYVYVSQDGWIIAYYSVAAPASMIMQWEGYIGEPVTTTTLQDAIAQICPVVGIDYEKLRKSIAFWHFKYPEAKKLLLAVDREEKRSHSFSYSVPYEATIFEGSWSLSDRGQSSYGSYVSVDGQSLSSANEEIRYGPLPKQHLAPGQHTVQLEGASFGVGAVAIVFIYG